MSNLNRVITALKDSTVKQINLADAELAVLISKGPVHPRDFFTTMKANLDGHALLDLTNTLYSIKGNSEEEWEWTPRQLATRALFPKTVDAGSDYGNENCHDLASVKAITEDQALNDPSLSFQYLRYAGERDSFGWLSGVEEYSLYYGGVKSFQLIWAWG